MWFYSCNSYFSIWGNYIESPDQQHEVRFLFTNGDTCPGDIERQTEV